jgi:hypothetical protein
MRVALLPRPLYNLVPRNRGRFTFIVTVTVCVLHVSDRSNIVIYIPLCSNCKWNLDIFM